MTINLRLTASAAVLAAAIFTVPACAQEPQTDRNSGPYAYAAPNGAPMSFADLIDQVSPAVVSIEASGTVERGEVPDMDQLPPQFREFFERFGGMPGQQGPQPRRSQG
ncbi:MAG: protease Do, partial [Oceanicaulis sp.]